MKKLTKKQKRDILRRAKRMYMDKRFKGGTGMCVCIDKALQCFIIEKLHQDPHLYGFTDDDYDYLQDILPEFNAIDLAGEDFGKHDYWWPLQDTQSRIDAFKKLIRIYQ